EGQGIRETLLRDLVRRFDVSFVRESATPAETLAEAGFSSLNLPVMLRILNGRSASRALGKSNRLWRTAVRSLSPFFNIGVAPKPEAERLSDFGPEFDEFWKRTAPELGIACARSSAFLNWRYRDHPLRAYQTFVIREKDELRGSVSVGSHHERGQQSLSLMELIANPRDPAVLRKLMKQTLAYGRQVGAWGLFAACTHPVLRRVLLSLGFISVPRRCEKIYIAQKVSKSPNWVEQGPWWMTSADGNVEI
ncbi:MAG: hypothetical protein JW937_02230, partial [Candidatus Omnitrophica bacterium]|nr:hypothetical protein [Candidatus Omnitrophota bacterium]